MYTKLLFDEKNVFTLSLSLSPNKQTINKPYTNLTQTNKPIHTLTTLRMPISFPSKLYTRVKSTSVCFYPHLVLIKYISSSVFVYNPLLFCEKPTLTTHFVLWKPTLHQSHPLSVYIVLCFFVISVVNENTRTQSSTNPGLFCTWARAGVYHGPTQCCLRPVFAAKSCVSAPPYTLCKM